MKKIAVIHHNLDYKKLLNLNLGVFLGVEVLSFSKAEDLQQLQSNDLKEIKLIISPDYIKDEHSAKIIREFLSSRSLVIPTLFLGQKGPGERDKVSAENWQEVVRRAAQKIEVTAKKMTQQGETLDQYYPIKVINLVNIEVETCATDVFDREDNGDYVTIIEEGEEFPLELTQDLLRQEIEFLYVHKDDRLKFINQVSLQILGRLKDQNLTTEQLTKAGSAGIETVRDVLAMSGMSEAAMECAQATIDSMNTVINGSKSLNKLLENLKQNSDSYLYKHSVMIAALSHAVISRMDWSNPEQLDKICFIAFFHDIALPEDRLAKINSTKDLEEADLTEEEKEKVKRHAFLAAEVLKNNKSTPFGAESVILQHHGQLNGIGFSDRPNQALSPLAIVFMVVEEYVDILLHLDPEFFRKETIFEGLSKKYKKGMYAQVIKALNEAVSTRSE